MSFYIGVVLVLSFSACYTQDSDYKYDYSMGNLSKKFIFFYLDSEQISVHHISLIQSESVTILFSNLYFIRSFIFRKSQ